MSCERLSERIQVVARGDGIWADDERRHLAECPDCEAEWRVVTSALSASAGLPPGFDPERIAAGVLRRLATEPKDSSRSRTWWYAGGAVAAVAAAAAVLSVIRTRDRDRRAPNAEPVAEWTIPVMGLDSLDEEQLRVVLESMDETLGTPTGPLLPSVLDLNDQELERVLRSMEG